MSVICQWITLKIKGVDALVKPQFNWIHPSKDINFRRHFIKMSMYLIQFFSTRDSFGNFAISIRLFLVFG